MKKSNKVMQTPGMVEPTEEAIKTMKKSNKVMQRDRSSESRTSSALRKNEGIEYDCGTTVKKRVMSALTDYNMKKSNTLMQFAAAPEHAPLGAAITTMKKSYKTLKGSNLRVGLNDHQLITMKKSNTVM